MEEKIIKDIYIISNIDSVKADIEKDAEHEINVEEMANFIEAEARTEFYFSDTLKSESEIKNVNRVWLDTGYTTPKGEAIFISLMKFEQKDSEPRYIFNGFYVGTAEYLVRGMCKSNKSKRGEIRTNFTRFKSKYENKIQKRERKHLNINANKDQTSITNPEEEQQTAVTIQENPNKETTNKKIEEIIATDQTQFIVEEIYDKLLFPMWNSKKGLERYLKILGRRITQIIDNTWEIKETEYYVMNDKKSVIVNTGLINTMGLDYMIQYRYHATKDIYLAYNVIESKRAYIENGYTKEQAIKKLKPIHFWTDETEAIINTTLDDFDISQQSLLHIINERHDRFPEEIQKENPEVIARYLFGAVERGIKILQRDPSYIKPTYSGETGTISWYMPFHIKRKFTEEPELVIVIRKIEGFFEIKTVLPYNSEIKDRITALSLYSKIW